MLKRLTQLDYDRDMAFVALEAATGVLAGIGRLSATRTTLSPNTPSGSHRPAGPWSRLGIARASSTMQGPRIGRIEGVVLSENEQDADHVPRIRLLAQDEPGLVEARPNCVKVDHVPHP